MLLFEGSLRESDVGLAGGLPFLQRIHGAPPEFSIGVAWEAGAATRSLIDYRGKENTTHEIFGWTCTWRPSMRRRLDDGWTVRARQASASGASHRSLARRARVTAGGSARFRRKHGQRDSRHRQCNPRTELRTRLPRSRRPALTKASIHSLTFLPRALTSDPPPNCQPAH